MLRRGTSLATEGGHLAKHTPGQLGPGRHTAGAPAPRPVTPIAAGLNQAALPGFAPGPDPAARLEVHLELPGGAEAMVQVRAALLSEETGWPGHFAERPGCPYRRRQAT
ncbi:MAG TPA: hypothetical protein VKA46_23645 [Gemmataceae bacterium]|nr:hypothetical protein [Gemmataceae bacterium]